MLVINVVYLHPKCFAFKIYLGHNLGSEAVPLARAAEVISSAGQWPQYSGGDGDRRLSQVQPAPHSTFQARTYIELHSETQPKEGDEDKVFVNLERYLDKVMRNWNFHCSVVEILPVMSKALVQSLVL